MSNWPGLPGYVPPEGSGPERDKTLPAEQRPHIKQTRLGSYGSTPGLTWWVWEDGNIKRAEFEEAGVVEGAGTGERVRRLLRSPGQHFTEALNLKNARRKFEKAGLLVNQT